MTHKRNSPVEITPEEFKQTGYQLIDTIADFIENINNKPVTTGESPKQIQTLLGNDSLPQRGTSVSELFSKTSDFLFNHSLLNGHPKFFGYITSSPAPIGSLADLLAAAVNPNVGANILSPAATAIEKQTVKWLAEFIGLSPTLWRSIGKRREYGKPDRFFGCKNRQSSKKFKRRRFGKHAR